MKPLIKWPGGKSREIQNIENLIPRYDRYIEPFFGGGAVFFNLEPQRAIINDTSPLLIELYRLVQVQDRQFHQYLIYYSSSFQSLLIEVQNSYELVYDCFQSGNEDDVALLINDIILRIENLEELVLSREEFFKTLLNSVIDKFQRTHRNNEKRRFSEEDLRENLITGFASGYYMYFRGVYNQLALNQIRHNLAFIVANFYYIREYCYGSMFRYNLRGEFNIPYGGISYNKKDFLNKVNSMFSSNVADLFARTEIHSSDFEVFLNAIGLSENDFIFLDPPYDTEFSEYDGRPFTDNDQIRLANMLRGIPARFILVIKNTDFIFNLYSEHFRIITFEKNYTYNVRRRNDRNVEHLIITNIPE